MTEADLVRFMVRIEQTETCWLWTGAINRPGGYGVFHLDRRVRLVHRLAYEHFVGTVPEGLDLDHLCRVRHCVRPDHLEPVTRAENLARGMGFIGDNVRKTHCPQGHPYSPENTYSRPAKMERQCRTCMHDRQIARRK